MGGMGCRQARTRIRGVTSGAAMPESMFGSPVVDRLRYASETAAIRLFVPPISIAKNPRNLAR